MKFPAKKIFKWTGIVIGSLLLLIVLLILCLRLPAVQNYVKGHLVTYLESKIKTEVALEKVYVGFPNSLIMENLYLKGQDTDTLLYVRNFDVGLNIPQLLRNKADLTSIDLNGVRAKVVRNRDGGFNFDYIIDAFATDEQEESPSKPFIISLDKIKLQDIGVSFTDLQARNDLRFYFKSFDTRVKTFDLEQNQYALNQINMDGLNLRLKQDLLEEVAAEVEETVDSLNQKKPMQLALQGIKFTNFNVDYGDENAMTFAAIQFRELSSKIKALDLEKNRFEIDRILLKGADINARLHLAPDNEQPESPGAASAENPLALILNRAQLQDVQVKYSNTATARAGNGVDFNHLDFRKLDVDLSDFRMENGTFAGKVKSAVINERSGLDIRKFSTDFQYGEKQAFLKDLYLETSRTVLRDEVVLNYNSPEQLTANPGSVQVSANIRRSKIGFADILSFVPSLRNTAPFNQYPNAVLNADLRARGTLNNMLIQNLELSGLDKTRISLAGTLKNAMQPERLYYDVNIREFSSEARTVNNLLPPGTIPPDIQLPSFFTLKGTAKGTTQDVNTRLTLTSTFGNAAINALVNMQQKNAETFDVKANLQHLQLGKIIRNNELGAITGQIVAKGRSFDPEIMTAAVAGNIQSLTFRNYTYRNMDLQGKINRGAYEILLNSKDPNAQLTLAASGVYDEHNPAVKVNGDITKLDVHTLGFYEDPLILAGKIDGDFRSLDPDALNGYLLLQNFAISDTKEVFPIQEIRLDAVSSDSINQIRLASQVADLDVTGKYKLTQIAGALQQTINRYYTIQDSKTQVKTDPGQYLSFNAKVKNDDLIRKFLPDLKSFEPITVTGNFNADTGALNVEGQIPQVTYGANSIADGVLMVNNVNETLQYDLSVAAVQSESFALNKVSVSGDVADDVVNYRITTQDEKEEIRFLIAGNLQSMGDVTRLSLNPDGLKLNYTDWAVDPENQIQFGSRGILARDFMVSNGPSRIAVQSETATPGSPLNITLQDFKIETLTEIIKKDTLLARGNINGTAQLRNLQQDMTFTSDLDISDLYFYENPVGNLDVQVSQNTAQLLNADITLSGYDNDMTVQGTYHTGAGRFNLNLDMNRLQMASVQGFTMGQLVNSEGYLSGNLSITGTADEPQIRGGVRFNQAGLEITQTGSVFRDLNDEIRFTNRGLNFNRFTLYDTEGNSMIIDGDVMTQNYRDFTFGFSVNADDFKVVNSEKAGDKIMYGVLAVDAGLQVSGNLDLPVVDGRLSVTDQTNFTFVLPQSSPTMQDRQGIVEFIDQDQVVLQQTVKTDSIDAQSSIRGMNVSVNIEVDPDAKLSLIIDKANGDFVELQGEADLTGGIDPSGKTTLVGVYEVHEGAYELSVSLLKRRFDIEKGSTITWTGEPTTANLDITAVYQTEAPPIDLVEQQIAGMSNAEVNAYKQRIPFNTLLQMKGELLKPEITFDITTDEELTSVSTTVQDNVKAKLEMLRREPSEMNKQVFALLLLNRFIGENPFQSEAGISAGTLARQSVSKILSQQLNNLASDLIEGVDLNFDLESTEDYSMGERNERTDLNVGVSKRLLNDRLKVSVGSNFGLEGSARQNEEMTNIAGDVAIDYSLSRDGRYMLRAYRKNEYQVALQGQIVETGVGFIITLDYNKFREIFERSGRNKKRKNNNQAESR